MPGKENYERYKRFSFQLSIRLEVKDLFKIYDDREAFYQWDLDRQVAVDDRTITQVHFCNRTGDCALVCECYELDGHWVADVPNILLQDNWRMRVYAYDGNATRYDDCFDIKARTKPDTYVYTETEVMTYERLEAQIDAIQEDIGQAVADYLTENPPVVELDNYYNKEETDNKFALKEEVPSIVGLATEEYVNEKVSSIEIPEQDLTGYATEKYVDDAIAAVELIPGPQGPIGETGPQGEPGVPGKDGVDGKDGYTPVKGVDYFDGAPGQDGAPGVPGKDGQDGKTPVKGTDYWTAEDKNAMVQDVIAALPVYNGEVV